MTAFSNFFENALLNVLFHPEVFVWPSAAIAVALWIGDPTDTGGGGTEVIGGGYTRKVTIPINWSNSIDGSLYNEALLNFPVATTNWGTVSHFALFNTLGNFMFHGPLDVPVAITTGQVAAFPVGSLFVILN